MIQLYNFEFNILHVSEGEVQTYNVVFKSKSYVKVTRLAIKLKIHTMHLCNRNLGLIGRYQVLIWANLATCQN